MADDFIILRLLDGYVIKVNVRTGRGRFLTGADRDQGRAVSGEWPPPVSTSIEPQARSQARNRRRSGKVLVR